MALQCVREEGKARIGFFPIREGEVKTFAQLCPSNSAPQIYCKIVFLLLRKISHCYISESLEPPEYHQLS
jgi:hypothetical protein